MNRVRLGLTGLALIFLIIVIAAVWRWPLTGGDMPKAEEEMLATLGVAPGAEEAGPPAPEPPAVAEQTQPLDTPKVEVDPLDIGGSEELTEI